MAGAPGGWECMVKRKLRQRKEKSIRKKKLKALLLKAVLFPIFLLVFVFDNAKQLHKFTFDDGNF